MKTLIKKYGAFNVVIIVSMFYGCLAAAVLTQICPGFTWFHYDLQGFVNNIRIMTTTANGLIVTSVMLVISFTTGLYAGLCEAQR